MFDLLVQATLSNLLVSTLLAGLAWIAQRRLRSASLVNLFWVIVLVKLVTPPAQTVIFEPQATEAVTSLRSSIGITTVSGSTIVALSAVGSPGRRHWPLNLSPV